MDLEQIIVVISAVLLGVLLAGGAAVAASSKPEFLGHPKGLYMLFFAEMWERFSFYGMRALLIFYLTQHWLFNDSKANVIYGAYGALVYIAPVLGGYVADRYIGQRRAVQFGALLLTIGHLLMAFEGSGGQGDPAINIFWLALAFIIVGSGFLKANISVMVGQLYPLKDVRRDGAYTIFYMGINIGAFVGTVLAGYLGQTYGWSYGFGAAGLGMLLGLIVFVLGRKSLLGNGEAPGTLTKATEFTMYGLGFVAIGVAWFLIQYTDVIQNLLIVCGIALLGYVLFQAFKLEKEPRERIFAILFLVSLNPLFWGLFEQAGGSLNLYTDRYVDRAGIDASIFQSINPFYIIVLAPVFAWLWTWLGRRGLEPSAPAKFGLALLQIGLAYLVFVWGANTFGIGPELLTPILFVFLIYLLQTTGELCLSPVGLSAMNRLAPSFMASLIMGAWFYMSAVGNFVAGKIGEAAGGESGELTKEGTLAIYTTIGWVSIGVAAVVLALSPIVKRWMHLDTLQDEDDLAGRDELAENQAAGMFPKSETAPDTTPRAG